MSAPRRTSGVRLGPASVGSGLAAVVVGGFLSIFYLVPVGAMLLRGLSWHSLAATVGEGRTWSVVWFTIWQAAVSTAATLAIGLPIARVLSLFRFPGRGLLRVVAIVPFVLPTVVVASAFMALDGRLGLAHTPLTLRDTTWGIVAAHVFFNVAVVVRTVGGWWAQLDNHPEMVAKTLGAGPVATFVHVTLPRLRPAVLSATAIVFLFSSTSFGVILLLGGPRHPTVETEIWRYATQRTDFGTAAVLGLIQLCIVLAMLAVNSTLQRRVASERQRASAELERRPTTRRERAGVAAGAAMTVALLGAPIAVLVERSLATDTGYGLGYYRALSHQDDRVPLMPVSAWDALLNSLSWALMAMAIATIVGTLAAFVTVSRHRRLARVTDIATLAPLGTSAVLVGFGMMIALDEPPFDWRTSWWIVPVAQAVIGVPFVMRTVSTALRGIDPQLREVAAVLGAAPAVVRREIDLPIVSRSVAAGAAFAFAISIGEFGATSFLARPQRPTVPTAIFRLLGRPGSLAFGQAMALSVVLAAVTAVAVMTIDKLRTTVAGEL